MGKLGIIEKQRMVSRLFVNGGDYMIERREYVDNIMVYTDTPFVKLLTEVCRCGKSTILKMIMERLCTKRAVPEQQINQLLL